MIEKNKDKIQWVWIDCFTYLPLSKPLEDERHLLGLKLCIVSPELQNHGEDIETYATYIKKHSVIVDAICTKEFNVSTWKRLLD